MQKSQTLRIAAGAAASETPFGHFHHTTYNAASTYAVLNEPEELPFITTARAPYRLTVNLPFCTDTAGGLTQLLSVIDF